jgi:hypothetical protein
MRDDRKRAKGFMPVSLFPIVVRNHDPWNSYGGSL